MRAVREVTVCLPATPQVRAFRSKPPEVGLVDPLSAGVPVNIFVGNMSYETTEDEIRQAFQAHGEVTSAAIIMDRATGRSKGFGFVEMSDPAQATAAIAALNLKELHGRALTVNEARPKGAGGSAP